MIKIKQLKNISKYRDDLSGLFMYALPILFPIFRAIVKGSSIDNLVISLYKYRQSLCIVFDTQVKTILTGNENDVINIIGILINFCFYIPFKFAFYVWGYVVYNIVYAEDSNLLMQTILYVIIFFIAFLIGSYFYNGRKAHSVISYTIYTVIFFPISALIMPFVILTELITLSPNMQKGIAETEKDMKDNPITKKVKTKNYLTQKATNPVVTNKNAVSNNKNKSMNLFEMIGLENIKEQVRQQLDYAEFQEKRKAQGLLANEVNLHTIMTGNPGTGKTEVARALGKLYKNKGILPTGKFVEVSRSDIIGGHIGASEERIKAKINEAMGGVLFIDEAYSLYKPDSPTDFGHEVIDVLLKEIEDKKGKFVCILAGYKSEMHDFISSNPGLKDRFPINMEFNDYTPEELEKIFYFLCRKNGYEVDKTAKPVLKREIANMYRLRTKNFGNARAIRNMFDKVTQSISSRTKGKTDIASLYVILPEDIADVKETTLNANKLLEKVNRLIGMKELKNELRQLIAFAQTEKERQQYLNIPASSVGLHLVFTGNPGTGKTTVARMLGDIYHKMGLLTTGDFIEVSRADLVGSHIGETEKKTKIIIDKAVGGVLFIDEAYSLNRNSDNDFGKEAIDILLKQMEDNKENLMVIVAGYPQEMEGFISSNPGLKSRFNKTIFFRDYTNDELLKIFFCMLQEKNMILADGADEYLKKKIFSLPRNKNFGNGRDIRNLFDEIKVRQSVRLQSYPLKERVKRSLVIEKEDIGDMTSNGTKHSHTCYR